ncbi:MAG: tetratricopeptide repeat protein, partial [Prevotella sp.]|nr:tetratricopeptide repeat protein [Prevotella sp.]
MRTRLQLIWLTIVALVLTGCGADQALKKGDKLYALGEYHDAAAQYKKAYSQTPAKERALRGQRALKMAECYRRINYTQKAIAAYNNVIRYKQEDSLTHLRLAQQLMKNGNYKEAEKQFREALDSMPGHPLALNGLRSAQKAPEWKKKGSDYTIKRENFFNSRRSDY